MSQLELIYFDSSSKSASHFEEALTRLHVDVGAIWRQAVNQLGSSTPELDVEQIQDRIGGYAARHEIYQPKFYLCKIRNKNLLKKFFLSGILVAPNYHFVTTECT